MFAKIVSGISGSISFPSGAGSAIANFTLQSASSTGLPVPQSRSRFPQSLGRAVTPLAFVTMAVSSNVLFNSTPQFTFTFPTGTLSGNVYLAMYDSSSPSAGWYAIAGPAAGTSKTVTLNAQPLQQAFFANATYTFAIVETTNVLPAQTIPMGADYGLTHQCIRTPFPSEANFYVDNVDCPGGLYPTAREWITVAEIENPSTFGGPCYGANDQSVLINSPGSVVTNVWHGSAASGYSVEFKVDYTNTPNSCSPPTYTATGLIDNDGFSKAAFPRPDQAELDYDVTFNRTIPNGVGLTHNSVESGFLYWSTNNVHINYSVQVDTWADPGFWSPVGLPADVFSYSQSTDTSGNPFYSLIFDGSKLNPPLVTPPGTPTHIHVNWGALLEHAIAEGLAPAPINGWAGASGGEATVGFEVLNQTVGASGPMGDLVLSNYRYSAIVTPSNQQSSTLRRSFEMTHVWPIGTHLRSSRRASERRTPNGFVQ